MMNEMSEEVETQFVESLLNAEEIVGWHDPYLCRLRRLPGEACSHPHCRPREPLVLTEEEENHVWSEEDFLPEYRLN